MVVLPVHAMQRHRLRFRPHPLTAMKHGIVLDIAGVVVVILVVGPLGPLVLGR